MKVKTTFPATTHPIRDPEPYSRCIDFLTERIQDQRTNDKAMFF
jgi:hypothetical protein